MRAIEGHPVMKFSAGAIIALGSPVHGFEVRLAPEWVMNRSSD